MVELIHKPVSFGGESVDFALGRVDPDRLPGFQQQRFLVVAGLDGDVTCHWRVLPLMYARESDRVIGVLESVTSPNRVKKLLKQHDPMLRMIYQGRGQKVRAMFDRDALPRTEKMLRNKIKSAGFWMR